MITLDLKWASVLLDYERGPKKYVVKVVLSLQQKLKLFCMSLNNFLLGTDHLSFVAEWGGEGVSGQFLLSSFLSFFLYFFYRQEPTMAVPFLLLILTTIGKSFSARPAIALVYIKLPLSVLISFVTVAPTMGKQKLSTSQFCNEAN